MSKKNEVLQKATAGNIAQSVTAEIANYFDEYINAGFITSIDGKAGQTLKVFSEYCIITTKNESKKDELVNAFSDFIDDDDDDDDNDDIGDDKLFSLEDKLSIAKGIMSGKLVQTGIGAAVSAATKREQNEKIAEQKSKERQKKAEQKERNIHKNISRLITAGERKVNLHNISFVETFSKSGIDNGYVKFVKIGADPNTLYDCEYFFFKYSIPFKSKKIKQSIESIKNILTEQIDASKQRKPQKAERPTQQRNKVDAFEEIRKYKQLLDEGIITEEEFNIKKKELLKL